MAGYGNRVLGGATSGLGQALGALMLGDRAQQQGFDTETTAQSKLAQTLAMVQQAQAAARLHDAQALETGAKTAKTQAEADVLGRRQALADEVIAASSGVDVPTLTAWRQKQRTGVAPQVPMGPPAEDGSMGQGSAQFGPATSSRIAQQLVRLAPVLNNAQDLNPEQYAKGANVYRTMDLGDQVLNGGRTAADVGRAQAAVEAKPLYHAGENGAVLDLFGGGLNESGGLAQGGIALKKEQAGAQRANAAQSYAAADHSRAGAAKTRAEMELGQKGTYDPTRGIMVDPRTSQARDVIGSDGKPIGARDKDLNGEQANALTFASRMQAAHQTLDGLSKEGVTQPSLTKRAADAVPVIGPALGMAANRLASEKQQQVEQAQRDFINAVLRRESGAAISMGEFANAAQQYFPQPNDRPAVIEQKRLARQRVIDGMLQAVPASRRPAATRPAAGAGGGGGSWDTPDAPAAAPGSWKIERVN